MPTLFFILGAVLIFLGLWGKDREGARARGLPAASVGLPPWDGQKAVVVGPEMEKEAGAVLEQAVQTLTLILGEMEKKEITLRETMGLADEKLSQLRDLIGLLPPSVSIPPAGVAGGLPWKQAPVQSGITSGQKEPLPKEGALPVGYGARDLGIEEPKTDLAGPLSNAGGEDSGLTTMPPGTDRTQESPLAWAPESRGLTPALPENRELTSAVEAVGNPPGGKRPASAIMEPQGSKPAPVWSGGPVSPPGWGWPPGHTREAPAGLPRARGGGGLPERRYVYTDPWEVRLRQVHNLAAQGLDVTAMAKEMGLTRGEVLLLLGISRRVNRREKRNQ